MTEKPTPRKLPNMNFSNFGGDAVIGDQHKGSGDIVQGDKVGNQVKDSSVEGDVTQTQTNSNISNPIDKVNDFLDILGQEISPSEITEQEPLTYTTEQAKFVSYEDFSEVEEMEFAKDEDHPENLKKHYQEVHGSSEYLSEESQKNLFQRTLSSIKKYGTSPEALAAGKMAVAGLEEACEIPPFNVITAVIKSFLEINSS